MPQRGSLPKLLPVVLLGLGAVAALAFTLSFPAVEGLGTKVRLPVFHGALTWVNLAAFSLMAVIAVLFLALRRPSLYPWEEGLRWVSVAIWIVGSGLGLMAALQTWDFTGSSSAPLEVAAADPRLMAQFWVALAALAVLALGLVLDDRRWLAAVDVGFVGLMWAVILRAVLGPGRALHPDSPVMNSDEIFIKLVFFGIVASIAVANTGAVWMLARLRSRAGDVPVAKVEALR